MTDDAKMEVGKPKKKFTWGLFLTGTFLFLIEIWFGMSTLHYKASETIFPFRTAGWFILGFVFVALFSCSFSAVFCFIVQKFRKTAWVLMLIVSALFLYKSINSALPYNRMVAIIGEKAAGEIKLEEFYAGDSFNDGIHAYGIISGDENTMKLIAKYRMVNKVQNRLYVIAQYFKNHKFPESGDIYSDEHGYFYVSPGDNKIYFYWHSFIYRAKSN